MCAHVYSYSYVVVFYSNSAFWNSAHVFVRNVKQFYRCHHKRMCMYGTTLLVPTETASKSTSVLYVKCCVMFLPQKFHSFYSKCYSPLKLICRSVKMSKRKKYIRERTNESNSPGIQLQVIGTGAADQPAIVALNAIDNCYLFNCGEGIGRHCQESKINLKRISNIFFTQSKWQCIGGITSVYFVTIAHFGYPPKMHGPENLQKIVQRTAFLSSLGGLFEHRFKGDSFSTTERFEDKKIVVEPIQLNYGQETAMLYLCKLKARQGGFSLQKSVDKNVPATLLPRLFNGETITLDDGSTVESIDVRYPDMPELNLICELKLNRMSIIKFLSIIFNFYHKFPSY